MQPTTTHEREAGVTWPHHRLRPTTTSSGLPPHDLPFSCKRKLGSAEVPATSSPPPPTSHPSTGTRRARAISSPPPPSHLCIPERGSISRDQAMSLHHLYYSPA